LRPGPPATIILIVTGCPVISETAKKPPIRFSEIALLAGLVLLFSVIRIYYGGSQGLMIVWKGEISFQDTLVNLDQLERMPKPQLQREHPSVYWQMLAMDLVEDDHDLQIIRKRREVRHIKAGP
jgi:hypothetical protein